MAVSKKTNKKTTKCSSKLFEPLTFYKLPRSPIRFDKDRLAEFQDTKAVEYNDLTEVGKVAKAYAMGHSFYWIRETLGVHPETAKRHVRKILNAFFDKESLNLANTPEWASPQKTKKNQGYSQFTRNMREGFVDKSFHEIVNC